MTQKKMYEGISKVVKCEIYCTNYKKTNLSQFKSGKTASNGNVEVVPTNKETKLVG